MRNIRQENRHKHHSTPSFTNVGYSLIHIPSAAGDIVFVMFVFTVFPLTICPSTAAFAPTTSEEIFGLMPLTLSAQVVPGAIFCLTPEFSRLLLKRAEEGAGRLET